MKKIILLFVIPLLIITNACTNTSSSSSNKPIENDRYDMEKKLGRTHDSHEFGWFEKDGTFLLYFSADNETTSKWNIPVKYEKEFMNGGKVSIWVGNTSKLKGRWKYSSDGKTIAIKDEYDHLWIYLFSDDNLKQVYSEMFTESDRETEYTFKKSFAEKQY